MFSTFYDLISSLEEEFKDATAFQIKNQNKIEEISYLMFANDVKALAGWISKNGYTGKNIGLIGKNSYEWIVWYFAIIIGGAIAIPINKSFPKEMVEEIIVSFDIYILLYDKEELDWIENLNMDTDIIRTELNVFPKAESELLLIRTDPQLTSCIILTSGTMGKSKGVMLSQKNLLTTYQIREDIKTVLLVLPFHHIAGIDYVLGNLHRGNTSAINESMKQVISDIQFFQPDEILVVPSLVELLVGLIKSKKEKTINSNLSRLISCGAPLQAVNIGFLKEYGIEVCQVYGLTESSGIVTLSMENMCQGVVGKMQEWNTIETEEGEIKIKGDNIMSGYYKDPKATKEVLRNGWLYTGDLGFIDEDGLVHINGRKKNLIILSNGENICPEELESIMGNCPYVDEVIVKSEDDRICAEIFPKSSEFLSKEVIQNEIREFIKNLNMELPTFKQIRRSLFRSAEFKKTAVGKIIRTN